MNRHYDVLMITDCTFPGGTTASVFEEATALHRAGYTLGLLHVPSPRQGRTMGFAPRMLQLLEQGVTELVNEHRSVSAGMAIARNPTIFSVPPADPLPSVTADQLLMVANQVPADRASEAPYYDVEDVHNRMRSIFGKHPQWAPIGPVVRASLNSVQRRIPIRKDDWQNIIDISAWASDRLGGFVGSRPIIGRHSRSHWSKWPSSAADLLAAYPDDIRYGVKVLGGAAPAAQVLGYTPTNWTVLPFNAESPKAFLAQLDFFVYFHHPGLVEAFGRALLEAVASGLVVIAPPYMEATFGSACCYTRPEGVRNVVDRFYRNEALYAEHVSRAVDLVRERFSYEAHVSRVSDLIGPPRGRPGSFEIVRGAVSVPAYDDPSEPNSASLGRDTLAPRRPSAHATQLFWSTGSARKLLDYEPYDVEHFAIRTRSFDARHLLVDLASRGKTRYEGLLRMLRRTDAAARLDNAHLDPVWALRLGRVLAFQSIADDDLTNGGRLMHWGYHNCPGSIDSQLQHDLAQVLLLSGMHAELRAVLPQLELLDADVEALFRADLANPFVEGTSGSIDDWHAFVSRVFASRAIEPIEVSRSAGVPFDRLASPAVPVDLDGPMMSVIVTTFRPGPELLLSIESLLKQSYGNLEILLVDDASPDKYSSVLDSCRDLDRRVRVLRQEANGGTYLARNRGLAEATGVFVTGQDGDDWSHPRRIELQVAPLLSSPQVRVTRGWSLRATANLTFCVLGAHPMRPNMSSMMFRTAERDGIGYYDHVRKGGDSEYYRRLLLGETSAGIDVRPALSLIRLGDGTLSAGDFGPGRVDQSRPLYRSMSTRWHQDILAGRAEPYMPPGPSRVRKFYAPREMLRNVPGFTVKPGRWDVLVLADWNLAPHVTDPWLTEIRAVVRSGLTVAVGQIDSGGRRASWAGIKYGALLQMISDGEVDLVRLGDDAQVGCVLVRDPSVLLSPPYVDVRIDAERAVVVVDRQPGPSIQPGSYFSIAACRRSIAEMFGLAPEWAVRSIVTSLFESDGHPAVAERVTALPYLPVPPVSDGVRRARRPGRPVLGTIMSGRSSCSKERWYDYVAKSGNAAKYDWRVMDCTPPRGSEAGLVDLLVMSTDDIDVRAYLHSLDFFVHVPGTAETDGSEEVRQALEAGCIVLSPEAGPQPWAPYSLVADSYDLTSLVDMIWSDAARRKRQIRQGRSWAQHNADSHEYYESLCGLLSDSDEVQGRKR